MKTAISLPDELFRRADDLAAHLGISRSGLYARALVEYVDAHAADNITETLNEVYADMPSTVDATLAQAQVRAVAEEW